MNKACLFLFSAVLVGCSFQPPLPGPSQIFEATVLAGLRNLAITDDLRDEQGNPFDLNGYSHFPSPPSLRDCPDGFKIDGIETRYAEDEHVVHTFTYPKENRILTWEYIFLNANDAVLQLYGIKYNSFQIENTVSRDSPAVPDGKIYTQAVKVNLDTYQVTGEGCSFQVKVVPANVEAEIVWYKRANGNWVYVYRDSTGPQEKELNSYKLSE